MFRSRAQGRRTARRVDRAVGLSVAQSFDPCFNVLRGDLARGAIWDANPRGSPNCYVCIIYVDMAVAMANKEAFSAGPADGSIAGGPRDHSGGSSRPKPEDGLRLMHAFLSIQQDALREAIIQFVTELSALRDDGL